MITLSKMSCCRLLCLAFYVLEALSLVSFAVLMTLEHLYPHESLKFGGTVPAVLMISLVGLLIVCVFLRRSHRRLAFFGWITAFALLLYVVFVPVIS